MGDVPTQQRVFCRRCRFRFDVLISATENWQVEAQCPSCDGVAIFTIADTIEPPLPDPRELEATSQRLMKEICKPINENRGHPALVWMERVSNGVFQDDRSRPYWPIPWWVYRFTRGNDAAYIWQMESSWFVRGWHSKRGDGPSPGPAEVPSFKAALDHLVDLPNDI
jgi:hypothetical protein